MIVIYQPENGDEQRWEFDPRKVPASKAEMIERRAGESWEAWLGAVQSGSIRARRVLLWHLLTIRHYGLRWEDVPDFMAGELVVQNTLDELTAMRNRAAKAKLPADQRAQVMTALDLAITEATERDPEPEGKALSQTYANDTPSR